MFYNTQSQGGPTHNICFKEEDPLLFSLHLFFYTVQFDPISHQAAMGMGGMPQNMGQMRPNFPQAWAELQCLTRRVVQAYLDLGILHTVGRVWGAVSSCFQQLGVWGQPTDVLSGWQWHLALTCLLGSRCWRMFLSNPFRCDWQTLSALGTARRGVHFDRFPSFSFLVSCPSFFVDDTQHVTHSMCEQLWAFPVLKDAWPWTMQLRYA